MGADVSFDRHITISTETKANGVLKWLGYKDINDEKIKEIIDNKKLQYLQISEYLPDEAYQVIDYVLSLRPDITFRLFHFLNEDRIDISFLKDMPHVNRLSIDCINLKDDPTKINLDVLTSLHLKSLRLDCFDLRDYSLIQELSDELESLSVMADTMGPGINFDCSWLMKYAHLNTIWLGKKAKKNLESLGQHPSLKSMELRGIKLKDFSWLKQMNLEKFALLWNSNDDLHELSDLNSLKEIELWRINKLNDISFFKELKNLEIIKLQDLKHVESLPDLSEHVNLQRLFLIDTGIDINKLPNYLKSKVSTWDDR